MKKISLILLAAAVLYAISGCNPASNEEVTGIPANQSTDHGINQAAQSTAIQPKKQSFVPNFESTDLLRPLLKTDSTEPSVLLASKKFNEYEVEIYRKIDDPELVYAKIKSADATYEIGQIGYSSNQTAEDFLISQVNALSESWIKVTGYCGANCPISDYIEMDGTADYKPQRLHLEAHTVEADVDNDGVIEIVATVGTAAETTIYKKRGEQIVAANLNQLMDSDVVTYDTNTNTFQAELPKGQVTTWKFNGEKLQWVPES